MILSGLIKNLDTSLENLSLDLKDRLTNEIKQYRAWVNRHQKEGDSNTSSYYVKKLCHLINKEIIKPEFPQEAAAAFIKCMVVALSDTIMFLKKSTSISEVTDITEKENHPGKAVDKLMLEIDKHLKDSKQSSTTAQSIKNLTSGGPVAATYQQASILLRGKQLVKNDFKNDVDDLISRAPTRLSQMTYKTGFSTATFIKQQGRAKHIEQAWNENAQAAIIKYLGKPRFNLLAECLNFLNDSRTLPAQVAQEIKLTIEKIMLSLCLTESQPRALVGNSKKELSSMGPSRFAHFKSLAERASTTVFTLPKTESELVELQNLMIKYTGLNPNQIKASLSELQAPQASLTL